MWTSRMSIVALALCPALALGAGAISGKWQSHQTQPDTVFLLKNGLFSTGSGNTQGSVKADGTDQPSTLMPGSDSVSIQIVDAHTVIITTRLQGKPTSRYRNVVSADGQVADVEVTNLAGPAPQVVAMRFTRVGAVPSGAHLVSGTWRLPSYTMTIRLTDAAMQFSDGDVRFDAHFDGKPYPVTADGPGHQPRGTVVLKRLGPAETEATFAGSPDVAGVSHLTWSADGQVLTNSWTAAGAAPIRFEMDKVP